MQFTDGALSGICIFNLSAEAAKYVNKGEISLDTAPTLGKEELYGIIKNAAEIRAALPCEELLTGIYHKRIGQAEKSRNTLFKDLRRNNAKGNISAVLSRKGQPLSYKRRI